MSAKNISYILFLLVSIGLSNCTTSSNEYCNGHLYCGSDGDTICQRDILRAEESAKNGKIYLCTYCGLSSCYSRYSNWIDSACATYGLLHGTELGDCEGPGGPDRNCFCHYMDKYLQTHYGKNFKKKVLRLADSMYVLNSLQDTLYKWRTDSDEKILIDRSDIEEKINFAGIKIKRIDYHYPYIKTFLLIDTLGNITIKKYHWEDSVGLTPAEQKNLQNQLFALLKKTKASSPCMLWKYKVPCIDEVNFSFAAAEYTKEEYYHDLMKSKDFSVSTDGKFEDALSDTKHKRGVGYVENTMTVGDALMIDFKFRESCCQQFLGDYTISNDTLRFTYENINDEECASICMYRYKLTIKNPVRKLKHIEIKKKSSF